MTEKQEQALLSFIKTDNVYHKYYDDVLILLKTGLRISELCGLKVADIDFKNEVVIIDHQLLKSILRKIERLGYLQKIFELSYFHFPFFTSLIIARAKIKLLF